MNIFEEINFFKDFEINFSTPINAVPSITLGASEVKPIEIISAYSTIANSG